MQRLSRILCMGLVIVAVLLAGPAPSWWLDVLAVHAEGDGGP